MIHYIKGKITEKYQGLVVIESGGIGYELNVPLTSGFYMADASETVTAYTYMAVREDDISLYGFDDRESLRVFRILTTVSGVGSKAALAILSVLSVPEIKRAIVMAEPEVLAKAQGVGKKTAQRIVVDLKDKFADEVGAEADQAGEPVRTAGSMQNAEDTVEALMSLGYSKSEASAAVRKVGAEDMESPEKALKAALRQLATI